jgi:hypothetical protein
VPQRFGDRYVHSDILQLADPRPQNWAAFARPQGRAQTMWNIRDPYLGANNDRHTNRPSHKPRLTACFTGRLWSLSAKGVPVRELPTWRWNKAAGRCEISSISIGGKSKRATHVIHRIMVGRYPGAGMVIDHRDRDPSNNAFSNLRECTTAENNLNRDCSRTRLHGHNELLEAGVQKRAAGYVVVLCRLYFGIYQSRHEANQIARQARRELNGEFAPAPVTWRRIIRPGA